MTAIMDWVNPTGELRSGARSFSAPSWTILEDLSVMVAPAKLRGDSTMVPTRRGRRPQPQIVDDSTFVFKMLIAGDVNAAGARYEDPTEGYYSNLFDLRSFTDPVDVLVAEDGCRDLSLTIPGYDDPLTARGQLSMELDGIMVRGLDNTGRRALLKRVRLRVYLPLGFFG